MKKPVKFTVQLGDTIFRNL